MQDDPQQQAEIKAEIAVFTGKLKKLRREVNLCEDIAMRSVESRQKVTAVREDEKTEKKEQRSHSERQKGQ